MASPSTGQAGENLVLFLSLVPFVMDRGEVSIDEAAQQFGRHPDDIRRAVELIACAGIPGDSAAYLHTDLFDIDWDLLETEGIIRFEQTIVIDHEPRLTAREVAALIAGLQYIAAHPRYGERSDVGELLAKLRGFGGEAGAGGIVINSSDAQAQSDLIAEAIDSGRQVAFDYVTRSGESERRTVDPVAVEIRDGVWYLRAWCHTREALRVFRVDRMSEIEVLPEASTSHPDVSDVASWSIFTPSSTDFVVTVKFPRYALPLVAEYLDRASPPSEHGSDLVADIPFAHTASLIRFVGQHAGLVTVIGPTSAVETVRGWAEGARKHIESS
ncbi:MAG: helix-turn-helix transcriptional regulator [Pontimonas sp.]